MGKKTVCNLVSLENSSLEVVDLQTHDCMQGILCISLVHR